MQCELKVIGSQAELAALLAAKAEDGIVSSAYIPVAGESREVIAELEKALRQAGEEMASLNLSLDGAEQRGERLEKALGDIAEAINFKGQDFAELVDWVKFIAEGNGRNFDAMKALAEAAGFSLEAAGLLDLDALREHIHGLRFAAENPPASEEDKDLADALDLMAAEKRLQAMEGELEQASQAAESQAKENARLAERVKDLGGAVTALSHEKTQLLKQITQLNADLVLARSAGGQKVELPAALREEFEARQAKKDAPLAGVVYRDEDTRTITAKDIAEADAKTEARARELEEKRRRDAGLADVKPEASTRRKKSEPQGRYQVRKEEGGKGFVVFDSTEEDPSLVAYNLKREAQEHADRLNAELASEGEADIAGAPELTDPGPWETELDPAKGEKRPPAAGPSPIVVNGELTNPEAVRVNPAAPKVVQETQKAIAAGDAPEEALAKAEAATAGQVWGDSYDAACDEEEAKWAEAHKQSAAETPETLKPLAPLSDDEPLVDNELREQVREAYTAHGVDFDEAKRLFSQYYLKAGGAPVQYSRELTVSQAEHFINKLLPIVKPVEGRAVAPF